MSILTSERIIYVLAVFKRNEVQIKKLRAVTSTDTRDEEYDTKLKSEWINAYYVTSRQNISVLLHVTWKLLAHACKRP
jgi:hypothetical protein